jgi:hypothetical protein
MRSSLKGDLPKSKTQRPDRGEPAVLTYSNRKVVKSRECINESFDEGEDISGWRLSRNQ